MTLSSKLSFTLFIILMVLWGIALLFTVAISVLGIRMQENQQFDISYLTYALLGLSWIFTLVMTFIYSAYAIVNSRVTEHQRSLLKEHKDQSMQAKEDNRDGAHYRIVNIANSITTHNNWKPLVSIIIPARNEEAVIANTIQNLLQQKYENIEILVVCHNCSDRTYEVAEGIKDTRVKPHNLITKEAGKAIALNFGVEKSSGKYLCIVDADNRLDAHFIENMMPLLEKKDYVAAQGKFVPLNREYNIITKVLSLEFELFSTPTMVVRHFFGKRTPLGGSGFMIRKDVLIQLGGFSNSLVEDYELSFRLYRKKYRVAFAPLSLNFSEIPPSMDIIFRQRSRWVKGFIDALRQRIAEPQDVLGNLFWVNPLSMIGALLYLVVAAFTAIYFALFGHLPYKFTYMPFLLWLISQTAMYSLQAIVLSKELKQVRLRDMLYLPIAAIVSNYWYVALLKAFFVKSWANTKTLHGFIVEKEPAIQENTIRTSSSTN